MRLKRFLYPAFALTVILAVICAVLPSSSATVFLESTTQVTEKAQETTSAPKITEKAAEAITKAETTEDSFASLTTQSSKNVQTTNNNTTSTTRENTTKNAAKTTKKVTTTAKPKTTQVNSSKDSNKASAAAFRAIWISYLEIPKANVTETQYEEAAEKMFSAVAEAGFNAAFVHVRANADSIYPSKIFPWAKWLTAKQGKNPGYDPLAILLAAAKKHKIAFHAWINPFRVQADSQDTSGLSADNPALKWLKNSDARSKGLVVKIAGGIYFNPAATEVHSLIYSGVREILQNYDVDGIHIDDYFYPSQSASIDKNQYNSYKGNGGKLSLADWRRAAVNTFVAGLYQSVKREKKKAIVSVSPGGNLKHNYEKLYADAAHWTGTPGYLDMIIPQLYYGFENQTMPFKQTAEQWNSAVTLSSVKLVLGLAAYKSGKADKYAGTGKNEWKKSTNILSRQTKYVQSLSAGTGVALFSYSYVLGKNKNDALKKELKKLYGSSAWQ